MKRVSLEFKAQSPVGDTSVSSDLARTESHSRDVMHVCWRCGAEQTLPYMCTPRSSKS